MIEFDTLQNDRWDVLGVFSSARTRNFEMLEVEDRAVEGRVALLKTVRKRDMPSERLLETRRRALAAEIDRTGEVARGMLPEPLDVFETEDGEQAIVYAVVGSGRGNFHLRHFLSVNHETKAGEPPSWSFMFRKGGRTYRRLPGIARYMRELAAFTEDLWRDGFVHANLSPDHLYILKDGVPRVTGLSAICRYDDDGVSADEIGLRNLALGYPSQNHRAAVEGRRVEPLDPHLLRWHSYAVLCLELLWGRDVRDWCIYKGWASIELSEETKNRIDEDFPAFINPQGLAYPQANARLKTMLARLRDILIKPCLERKARKAGGPSRNLYGKLQELWRDLEGNRYRQGLQIEWSEERYRRAAVDRLARFDNERPSEVMILEAERARSYTRHDGRRRTKAQYRAVQVETSRHSAIECFVDVHPREKYFTPGDVLPVCFAETREGYPVVRPVGWAEASGKHRSAPFEGTWVRALSLGRLERETIPTHSPMPWALVDLDGFVTVLPVGPPPDKRYSVFPRAGVFAEFYVSRDDKGRPQIVLHAAPPPWVGQTAEVTVRAVRTMPDGTDLAFFDLPVGDDYFATCILNRRDWQRPLTQGSVIPVRVVRVDHNIDLRWDTTKDLVVAGRGERFLAVVDRTGRSPMMRFGDERQFLGRLDHRQIPWGISATRWSRGAEVPVRVEAVSVRSVGLPQHSLDYEGPDPSRDPQAVFTRGTIWEGRVVGHHQSNLLVEISEDRLGPEVAVVGIVRSIMVRRLLARGRDENLTQRYPVGAGMKVLVRSINPAGRTVDLLPWTD